MLSEGNVWLRRLKYFKRLANLILNSDHPSLKLRVVEGEERFNEW